jgi:glycerophosphoryl diester phosphodiesterase
MRFKRNIFVFLFSASSIVLSAQDQATNSYIELMQKVAAHTNQYGAPMPVLSPIDRSVIEEGYRPFHTCITPMGKPANGEKLELVPVKDLQAQGIRVVPWTTNDPDMMRAFIRLGVDGLITDRPDLLQQVLTEERTRATDEVVKQRLASFDVQAHRGGCGLRPENTLPSFESGLDQLIDNIETDTGVSTDHVSTIWHDQFYSPEACRRVDGKPYDLANRVYLSDISSVEAQKTFICDKLPFGEPQTNDLSLSSVSVAFAKQGKMPNVYAPTNLDQLFRFVNFYVDYYRKGVGKSHPDAARRAAHAERVRFNIEIKNFPDPQSYL